MLPLGHAQSGLGDRPAREELQSGCGVGVKDVCVGEGFANSVAGS